ncbi:ribonuclease E inhibitor RraB [Mumia sp. DW29H23]|uniref:ribonuclease E inhibitor RraB n=1 Tax=Mumia sp. DW29H23 TaxID=3421241 RepID=UPI003D697954
MKNLDELDPMWEAQKAERLRLGDDLSVAREVEHFAYFRRKASAVAAAEVLVDRGFDVAHGRSGLKTHVCAARSEALEDDDVRRFLAEVVDVVEAHGGTYDGWGAETSG